MELIFDPETDLELVRVMPAAPATIWRCLTEPALLEQWFCPVPWQVRGAVIEPWPGGRFHTPMFGPEGQAMDEGPGCVVAAVPGALFAFTDSMGPGLHPRARGFMTGIYRLEPVEAGTRVTMRALHASPDDRDQHAGMGFFEGWGAAADQLAALAAGL